MSKSNRSKRPSMQDVADRAGVSRTTVSFILNQKPNVNIPKDTQRRVLEAVEALGYRPNAIARGLRSQRTYTIGFISDVVGTTPFAGKMLQGAQDFAWEHNNLLLSVNTGRDQALKEAAVNTMLDRQVDGIIYASMYHREVHPPTSIREVPTVLLDCFVEDRSLPSVVPDEILGGRTATETVIAKGHRRIAFVVDNKPVAAAIGRLDGYKQALSTRNIEFDPALIYPEESLQIGGYRAVKALMKLPEPPTAIFFFNDRMAMGAYSAAFQLNLSIPDDIAIIGFDNQELIAADLYPPLTTIALPHYEMGQWAVNHLLQLIAVDGADAQSPPVQHLLKCPLIIRESV